MESLNQNDLVAVYLQEAAKTGPLLDQNRRQADAAWDLLAEKSQDATIEQIRQVLQAEYRVWEMKLKPLEAIAQATEDHLQMDYIRLIEEQHKSDIALDTPQSLRAAIKFMEYKRQRFLEDILRHPYSENQKVARAFDLAQACTRSILYLSIMLSQQQLNL